MRKLYAGITVACAFTLGLFAADILAQSCTLTPNLGLCKGARGSAEWDVFLNSNFDLIDSQAINTTSGSQTKSGTLTLSNISPLLLTGAGFTTGNILFLGPTKNLQGDLTLFWDDSNNRLGVGTSSPTSALDVEGTVTLDGFNMAAGAGASKVLTSDGSGNGTWQSVSGASSGWTPGSGIVTLSTSGDKVGIGVSSPTEKLEVNGGVKVGAASTTQAGVIAWTGTHFQGYTGSTWVDLDYTSTASGGWTDGGTSITLTTSTDTLGIGAAASPGYKVFISAATNEAALGLMQSLTGTSAASLLNLQSTWNTTGVPTMILADVVDTASSSAAKLMELLVGGAAKFTLRKDGQLTLGAGLIATTGTFSGALEATTIKLTTGAAAGYVLTSDASGNGSWQASGAGAGIPSGMIALFDTSCPVGWTSISGVGGALNGKFPYGGDTYGATGGASTHTHDVNVTSFSIGSDGAHGHTVPMGTFTTGFENSGETASQYTLDKNVADAQHTHEITITDRTISSSGAHTHTVDPPNTTSTSGSSLPPYITMVYCKKS